MTSDDPQPAPSTAEERVARIGSISTVRAAVIAASAALIVGVLSGVISGAYAKSSVHDQAKDQATQARQDYLRGQRQTADAAFVATANKAVDQAADYGNRVYTQTKASGSVTKPVDTTALRSTMDDLTNQVDTIQILGGAATYKYANLVVHDLNASISVIDIPRYDATGKARLDQISEALGELGNSSAADMKNLVASAQDDIQNH